MCKTTLPPVLLENALKAYIGADANGKQLLENLHGRDVFNPCLNIMERVKTFQDICDIAGVDIYDYKLSPNANASEEDISDNAYQKIKLIVKVLNEGWKPNYKNSGEYKYYPYFLANEKGFGFSYYYCDFVNTVLHVGSRQVYKSAKLAEFAGKTFQDIYNEYNTYN